MAGSPNILWQFVTSDLSRSSPHCWGQVVHSRDNEWLVDGKTNNLPTILKECTLRSENYCPDYEWLKAAKRCQHFGMQSLICCSKEIISKRTPGIGLKNNFNSRSMIYSIYMKIFLHSVWGLSKPTCPSAAWCCRRTCSSRFSRPRRSPRAYLLFITRPSCFRSYHEKNSYKQT